MGVDQKLEDGFAIELRGRERQTRRRGAIPCSACRSFSFRGEGADL